MTAIRRRPRHAGLLRIHAWLILTAVVITVGSATAVVLTRPSSYVATAQVSVGPEQAGGTALRPEMASERQIALSGAVAARAADVLGHEPDEADDGVAVSVVIESSILNISYTAASPEAAANAARAFTQSYVDYRNSVAGTRIAHVVTWPDAVKPSAANLPLIVAVALLAGLVLGVAAAWVWDRVVDRVRDADEFTDRSGLPVLAEIPRWSGPGSLAPDTARAAFAYVSARVGTLGSQRDADLRIVVTSPRAGAGTTTVALNTAIAIAAQERDVVLVGADLQEPRLHEILDVPPAPGLIQVLNTACALESAVRDTGWQSLSVMTAGAASATHGGLQPDMLGVVLDQLSTGAIVVVDAPPILESADSLALVDKADVLLLVGDLRSGKRDDVERAIQLIEGIRPAACGWIANLPRGGERSGSDSMGRPKPVVGPLRPTAARSDRFAS